MVKEIKTIQLRYIDDIHAMLLEKKYRLGGRLKVNLSWEEFFLHLSEKMK